MKEENKYYTPTIEEFHVGFEYEKELCGRWYKEIFDSDNDILGNRECQTKLSEIHYGNLKVRVKHLDREDIESLGYEKTSNNTFADNEYEIELLDGNVLTINRYYITLERLFKGTIKNKSELIRILKQLNIV